LFSGLDSDLNNRNRDPSLATYGATVRKLVDGGQCLLSSSHGSYYSGGAKPGELIHMSRSAVVSAARAFSSIFLFSRAGRNVLRCLPGITSKCAMEAGRTNPAPAVRASAANRPANKPSSPNQRPRFGGAFSFPPALDGSAHLRGGTICPAPANKPWSAEEDAALLSLRAAGLKWHVIAKKLGRTEGSASSRAVKLRAEQTRHHRAGTLLRAHEPITVSTLPQIAVSAKTNQQVSKRIPREYLRDFSIQRQQTAGAASSVTAKSVQTVELSREPDRIRQEFEQKILAARKFTPPTLGALAVRKRRLWRQSRQLRFSS
jgi:hypothetical protein